MPGGDDPTRTLDVGIGRGPASAIAWNTDRQSVVDPSSTDVIIGGGATGPPAGHAARRPTGSA